MGPHGLSSARPGPASPSCSAPLVLGLAITHPPDLLNFVLVDFKGGATFNPLDGLPHTSAVITNLSDELGLVDRMKDAISGELNRRMELLRSAGNFASLRDYDQARALGAADLPALPTLLIVVDEFSELLAAKPDFRRSVHHHGSGRPVAGRPPAARLPAAGGGTAARPGHLPFLPDRAQDLLGGRVPDRARRARCLRAARRSGQRLPQVRHHGAGPVQERLRVRARSGIPGWAPTTTMAGWIRRPSGWPPRSAAAQPRRSPNSIRSTADSMPARTTRPTTPRTGSDAAGGCGRPAQRLRRPGPRGLAAAAERAPVAGSAAAPRVGSSRRARGRRCRRSGPRSRPDRRRSCRFRSGWVDKPYDQTRDLLTVDMSGAAGHVAIVGAPQSGKSTALRSLICALALTHSPGGDPGVLPGLRRRFAGQPGRTPARRRGRRPVATRPGAPHRRHGRRHAEPAGGGLRRGRHQLARPVAGGGRRRHARRRRIR